MSYSYDGHTALDSKVVDRVDTPGLNIVLIKRFLDDNQEDLVIHASSNVISSSFTALDILRAAGFQISRNVCPYFETRKCLYKVFERATEINLNELAAIASDSAPKLVEVEKLFNNCGWSIIKDRQRTINEGHRATEKQILKTEEDEEFKYVMTYVKDQHGNARFVTHYIPKQGPNDLPELEAAMEFLEMKTFSGCPESPYEQCFYTTLDNDPSEYGFNRPADKAHEYFNKLKEGFDKACRLLIEIDSNLRQVGLEILNYPTPEPASIISLSGAAVPDTSSLARRYGEEMESEYEWDVFISHASEDKDTFVRQLATELRERGILVWYDEFTLTIGDSLRKSIDKGLAQSRYGVVVLSPHFFNKNWPQDELNGLVVRERNGEKVILPIWLDVDQDYVAKYSPIIADRIAAKASDGMEKVISGLLEVIRTISSGIGKNYVDLEGRFTWVKGETIFNFGKYSGRTLKEVAAEDADYLIWIHGMDFSPEVHEIVGEALRGIFPKMP